MPDATDDFTGHVATVAAAILDGEVTPFLGAGVNLADDPAGGEQPSRGAGPLPSGPDLARRLHAVARAPATNRADDLSYVAQYIAVMRGWGKLYGELREVFGAEYQPTSLHRFLARLPTLLRENDAPQQLIVTTNYDDAMERAFDEVGEPYDMVCYVARPDDEHRGRFRHHEQSGLITPILEGNRYRLPIDKRPTILKIHGAVNRTQEELDGYVITEDHYIDYMARSDLSSALPVTLHHRLRNSNTLFLAYSLRDWNLRVFFRRVWGDRGTDPAFAHWAVQDRADPLAVRYWRQRGVELVEAHLTEYLEMLAAELPGMPRLHPIEPT